MKNKILAVYLSVSILFTPTIAANATENTENKSFFDMERVVTYVDAGPEAVLKRTYSTSNSFLVVTDGTKLTEEDCQNLPNFRSLRTIEWDDYAEIDYPDLSFAEGTEIYEVSLSALKGTQETARRFALQNDFVKEVYGVRTRSDVPVFAPCRLQLLPADENATLYAEDFPQFASIHKNSFNGSDSYWYANYSKEIKAEIAETCNTSYEEYLFSLKIAEEVMADYGDVLQSVEVEFCGANAVYSAIHNTQSIWDTAGDHNADGTVNAQDGADILQLAAELGTGASTAIPSASDVNADGTVDAQDAAAVLTFAAASGSGSPLTWVEILR